jgi:glycosyltransferase involved in cell wall biosynthesis
VRIAVVSEVFLPAVDGVVTRLRRTLEELPRCGDEVLMIAPAGGPESYAGVPVLGVRGLRVPLYPDGDGYPPKRVALPGPALTRALRAYRPDVVHAIQPVLLGVGAVAYARRNRVPLVASYHAHLPSYAKLYRLGWLESGGWRYLRGLHNCAQVNLATSCATLAELEGQRIERLALWPYGVDLARFHPGQASADWRERLSLGHPERLVLLYVGRLAKEKTVERLVEAVRGHPEVALAIVGDGPLRSQLERRFHGTNTTFLGFLGGPDLARAYASADVFVLPSQTETLGMVTLEAHAAGLPVVAAESPAARELVRHGVDGLRYDPGVPGALAGAVSLLAADPALRARMGQSALEAVSGATWRHATQILRGHYVRARERARPQPAAKAAGGTFDAQAELAALTAPEAVDPSREAV